MVVIAYLQSSCGHVHFFVVHFWVSMVVITLACVFLPLVVNAVSQEVGLNSSMGEGVPH